MWESRTLPESIRRAPDRLIWGPFPFVVLTTEDGLDFVAELSWRGLVQQSTDPSLQEKLMATVELELAKNVLKDATTGTI